VKEKFQARIPKNRISTTTRDTSIFKLMDLFAYKCRVRIQSRAAINPDARPVSVRELVRSYSNTYFNRKTKVFSPYFRYWLQDPLVCFLWWCQVCLLMLRATKQLGR
jgi:hypothetical protein